MYENNVNHSDYSSKDMYTVFLQDIVKKLSLMNGEHLKLL